MWPGPAFTKQGPVLSLKCFLIYNTVGTWGRGGFQRVHSGGRIEFTNYGVEKKNLRS